MRKALLMVALFASMAAAQTQTFTYSYSGLPMPIYPDDWNTWSVISVLVPRSIAVSKVTVAMSVEYSGVGDLNVFLWSPAGTRSKLLERNCGGLQNIDTTFDDSAGAMFNNVCPQPGAAPFRANEPLANSVNENGFGYWRLGVENNGSSRTGVFTGFSITITGRVLGPPVFGPNTIVSTSSLLGGLVAPGDQVSIFGANLGPTEGIRADARQTLPTSLGGTTVTFDGIAAPLYYVSDKLVQVQVPTALASASITKIQVTGTAGSSSLVAMPVFAANPGVFTYEVGGRGQAKAINQDGSANGDGTSTGSDTPAPPGSVIQVFATGLGPLEPSVPDGTPAPSKPLSQITLPIAATIGGRTAEVAYAGAAPTQVGVYQVNLVVPEPMASGPARLVLTVNGISCQTGVTVQIK